MAGNVVSSNCCFWILNTWGVSVRERGVGDKAVPWKEHFQASIIIQQGQTNYKLMYNIIFYNANRIR